MAELSNELRNKRAHPRLLSTSGSDAQESHIDSGRARYGDDKRFVGNASAMLASI